MDTAIVSGAGTLQLIGLAILLVLAIIGGTKVATGGSRGIAEVLPMIAAFLLAVWMIARPNDVMTLMLRFVGGVQTPIMPTSPAPAPEPSASGSALVVASISGTTWEVF